MGDNKISEAALPVVARYVGKTSNIYRYIAEDLAVVDAQIADDAHLQGEAVPVAWISRVCIGPKFDTEIYDKLPIQSLQSGYYQHIPLYGAKPMDTQTSSASHDVVGTTISHEREPHCCGCFVIHWNGGDPLAVCNECSHTVNLLDALSGGLGHELPAR